MFESIQPPKTRRPRIIVLLSIAAHAGAILLLAAAALWRVDKLRTEDAALTVAALPGAPMSVGDEPAAKPKRPNKKVHHPPQHELTQHDPDAQVDDDDSGSSGEVGDGEGQGSGGPVGQGLFPCGEGGGCTSILDQVDVPACGNGRVETGEECDDGNRAAGDGCTAGCKKDEERIVVARLIEGSRIEGNPRIEAPDSVRQAMVRAGQDKVKGMVKMCLDREGGVRSLAILRSTGHAEYDQRLLAGMRSWRYRPYRLDSGAAVPVCTVITFIYQVQ